MPPAHLPRWPEGTSVDSTPTVVQFIDPAASSSEAASLQGQPAKTPIIAGSVCGGVMGLAWIIGFAIYFRKRWKRRKHDKLVAQGKALPTPEKRPKDAMQKKIIIPPDPAVLSGQYLPGERVHVEERPSHSRHPSRSHSRAPSKSHSRTPSKSKITPSNSTSPDATPRPSDVAPLRPSDSS